MLRSFRFWCFLAAAISLATTALHVFGGGPKFHEPALASALSVPWKAAFSTIWHEVTALLFLNGMFLACAGLALRKNTLLLWLVLGLNAAFGVLFMAYGMARLGTPWILMQWVIFATISLCIALALGFRDALQEVEECETQPELYSALPGASFVDTYVVYGATHPTAFEVAHGAFGQAPRWIDGLMTIRNLVVRPFGLKHGPQQISTNRIGFFPILQQSDNRMVLGLDDTHLDFRVVVDVLDQGQRVSLTTLVKPHNLFGRIYLAIVMPFHRLIAPTILRQAVR